MSLSIVQQSSVDLHAYDSVPIAFTASQRWNGNALSSPFIKDYDAIPGHRPIDWPQRFNLSGWRFAAAFLEDVRVGGATVALQGCEIEEIANWQDAVLWDLRVHPEYRRRGAGRGLLRWAENVALSAKRARLLVETQDINTAACEFYCANGYPCLLIDPLAYPELPNEARIFWAKSFQ
ncbi:GNAT family N-acetyltransferase [Granulicella arctica]|uniref:GNAT family N-acetyltransferase n=1 Tax=Granulicella arctica TaxID=940613 RepID=UPI0021E0C33F|nr:GNAT family N-acetyltransferase [Granulicella arctica]